MFDLPYDFLSLVIAIAVIIGETECEMAFGKIRLQSQGFIRVNTRFFPACLHWVGIVVHPALHHRETGKSRGEVWIELDRLLKKRLSFQRCGRRPLVVAPTESADVPKQEHEVVLLENFLVQRKAPVGK